ncbi:MAG: response regulator [Chloroflexi bacterium]|nr:response regulator [Chloroflexota bacterium]
MLNESVTTKKILAVDDNTFTLRIVQHTLEQAGYQVTTAVSAKDALKNINRHGIPHLAIVDLHMPVMSGFEFCREVREFSDLPIILLTAVNNEENSSSKDWNNTPKITSSNPFNPSELVAPRKSGSQAHGRLYLHPRLQHTD